MKYEISIISCGTKTYGLCTDDIEEARSDFQRLVARGSYVRLSVNGKTLPICEADRLMGRKHAGIEV